MTTGKIVKEITPPSRLGFVSDEKVGNKPWILEVALFWKRKWSNGEKSTTVNPTNAQIERNKFLEGKVKDLQEQLENEKNTKQEMAVEISQLKANLTKSKEYARDLEENVKVASIEDTSNLDLEKHKEFAFQIVNAAQRAEKQFSISVSGEMNDNQRVVKFYNLVNDEINKEIAEIKDEEGLLFSEMIIITCLFPFWAYMNGINDFLLECIAINSSFSHLRVHHTFNGKKVDLDPIQQLIGYLACPRILDILEEHDLSENILNDKWINRNPHLIDRRKAKERNRKLGIDTERTLGTISELCYWGNEDI